MKVRGAMVGRQRVYGRDEMLVVGVGGQRYRRLEVLADFLDLATATKMNE